MPALFAQDEFAPTRWLSLAGSARVDAHSDYGTFFSPRVSALFRTAADWSLRASVGTGFAAPTPLIEDVQARSLGLLNPLRGLRAERASSMSLDAKWAREAVGRERQRVLVRRSAIRSTVEQADAAAIGWSW